MVLAFHDMQELKKIDQELYEISQKLLFLEVNPLNDDSEKKKFFAISDYEPQF